MLRPHDEIDAEYLFYFLSRDEFREAGKRVMSGAVGHKRIPNEFVNRLQIPLPPMEEQRRIVAILDEAHEGLARAHANAEANLAGARRLFEEFLRTKFRCTDDWEVEILSAHIRFIDYRGKTPPKADSGIRLITAKNVKIGYIRRHPEEYVPESEYSAWMTRGIPIEGDVLFTTEAPLANVATLDTSEKLMIGQRIITMRPDPKLIRSDFLKFALMAPQMQETILQRGTGATVLGIKARLLKLIPFAYPKTLLKQDAIAADCGRAFEGSIQLAEQARAKLADLAALKQFLLAKAFRGDLT